MCDAEFEIGARGCVIGNVTADGTGELRWVHIECLLRSVVGDTTAATILRARPELRTVRPEATGG